MLHLIFEMTLVASKKGFASSRLDRVWKSGVGRHTGCSSHLKLFCVLSVKNVAVVGNGSET